MPPRLGRRMLDSGPRLLVRYRLACTVDRVMSELRAQPVARQTPMQTTVRQRYRLSRITRRPPHRNRLASTPPHCTRTPRRPRLLAAARLGHLELVANRSRGHEPENYSKSRRTRLSSLHATTCCCALHRNYAGDLPEGIPSCISWAHCSRRRCTDVSGRTACPFAAGSRNDGLRTAVCSAASGPLHPTSPCLRVSWASSLELSSKLVSHSRIINSYLDPIYCIFHTLLWL